MTERATPDPEEHDDNAGPKKAPKDGKEAKNEHAAALGRLGGLKGGKARAAALSPEERKEGAKKAAAARWGGAPKTLCAGILKIGSMEIPCAVLDDKTRTRVISQRGFYAAVGASTPGSRRGENGDDDVPVFFAAANLKPFISSDLAATARPIVYRQPAAAGMRGGGGGFVAHGFDARLIPDMCEVWLKAREAGALYRNQRHIAAKAEVLVRGLARVGIIALVDEVTGYQAERDDLTRILQAYITPALQPWFQRFPHVFFKQIHRLWGWVYVDEKTQGPRYVGKLINKYIYDRLPPGVHEELRTKNPSVNGRRKYAHHRWLTDHTGIPHLDRQITAVTTLLSISDSKADFESHLKKAFPKKGDNLEIPFPKPPKNDEEE